MKKIIFFTILFGLLCSNISWAQNITLQFTGCDAENGYVQLNRVMVTNHTQGWQETLSWPDTTLTLKGTTGVAEYADNGGLFLSQNNPNPFSGTTDVSLTSANAGEVTLEITDMNGRVVATHHRSSGNHRFHITLSAAGTYLLTARQNGKSVSVKMVCRGGGSTNAIEYAGEAQSSINTPKQVVRSFTPNDLMEYVGYATLNGIEVESRRIVQVQDASQTLSLLFMGMDYPLSAGASSIGWSVFSPIEAANSLVAGKSGVVPSEKRDTNFRVALSLSPFSLTQFQEGYTFTIGDRTATTPQELQQIYRDLGSTEMYVRIATKRHVTAEDITDGEPDDNANFHTFDQGIALCQIAAELGIPINPEIMCAFTYMDMDRQQAPRFDEYPEIYALQNGKRWEELTLDEICVVLEAYGAFVGEAILSTGCTVNNWNLGNEANFGFAGISMGLETAVNPKLQKAGNLRKYTAPVFARGWLKRNVWKYDAPAYAAVKRGILSAYDKLGIDASDVKFSTHIATVVFPPKCSVKFFEFMKDNGYEMETAGISYYPSAPSLSANKKKLLKKTITKINQKCDLPVFIGEFSYPSGEMDGPFAGWNKKVRGYKHDEQGQANIYADVVKWGRENGMAGIRYWAPDYKGWYSMSMFEFSGKKGTAKAILKNHRNIIGR